MRQKLFEIAGIPIYGYGTMVLLGVLTALWLLGRNARRRGWNPEVVQDSAIFIVLSGLLGGRLFYFIQFQEQYSGNWLAFFKLWEGGLVLYGAMFGGLASLLILCRIRKFPVLAFLDLVVPSVAVGIGFGRLGCLLNGCCWGKVCRPDFAFALTFPPGSPPALDPFTRAADGLLGSLTLHPTQVYASFNGFLMAWVLWRFGSPRPRSEAQEIQQEELQLTAGVKKGELNAKESVPKLLALQARKRKLAYAASGSVIGLFSLLYGLARFTLENLRGDHHPPPGSWPVSQLISCAVIAVGVTLLVQSRKLGVSQPDPQSPLVRFTAS